MTTTRPLIIVESGAIAQCLQRIVGQGMAVCSTDGQICDLPTQELGVDPETYLPRFQLTEKGRRVIKHVRRILPEAGIVYLAVETSAAGENLAAQLVSRLRLTNYRRVHLTSLTEIDVREALAISRPLDFGLVRAHQARRAIDRLIGYSVSRPLGLKLGRKGLPAGRLQAAIIAALLEPPQRDIRKTDQACFEVTFDGPAGPWVADCASRGFDATAVAEQVVTAQSVVLRVVRATSRTVAQMPPAPLTTPAVLLSAARHWGYLPERVLDGLRNLFHAGLINQPLTYSPNLCAAALQAVSSIIVGRGLPLSKSTNRYPAPLIDMAGAEALRPTCFDVEMPGTIGPIEQNLYTLIWTRAVQSQLAPAMYAAQELHLVDQAGHRFVAAARQLIDAGYLGFSSGTDDRIDSDWEADGAGMVHESPPFPDLPVGFILTSTRARALPNANAPILPRTSTDLVSVLDGLDVGRADAIYSVLRAMIRRGIVQEGPDGQILATDLAHAIHEKLHTRFSYTHIDYLRGLEAALRSVALGRRPHTELIQEFWTQLSKDLHNFESERVEPLPHGQRVRRCPECREPMDLTTGPHGPFWACSGFISGSGCEYTESR